MADAPALTVTSPANRAPQPLGLMAEPALREAPPTGALTLVRGDPAPLEAMQRRRQAFAAQALPAAPLPRTEEASIWTASAPQSETAAAPAGDADQEEEEEIIFEADAVSRADDASPIVAEGNVRAHFGGRLLRADRLTYNPDTDVVVAEGDVAIVDAGRTTTFAGRVELSGDLRDGIAENFSALLAENAKLAADHAVQEQGARTRLSHAVYTACDVCDEDGEGKTPTWRLKALRVTRDMERKVVRFHHAFFEIKGVPILYAPFLQAPDPSVERQSGFLTPVIGTSSRRGFNFELPYYLALSNHHDATFSPKYTSNDGVLWQGEYRRRDVSGAHVVQAGVLDFDNNAPEDQHLPDVRWHIFGRGHRDFGDHWRVGYDVERVSDDTYLRQYDIQRRGDLTKEIDTSSTNRLRTNGYVRWERDSSEFQADAYLFQGLRSEDDDSLTPYVLPLMNYRRNFDYAFLGGRAHVNANFAALQREAGADTRRFTASAYWNREHITANGHRFNAFAELRGDLFHYSDLDEGTETMPGVEGDPTRFEGRFAPSVGAEWSYPLTRRAGGARLFIEPRVQLVASPSDPIANDIINEDSQSIEYDYAGLFEYNKATGYDLWEDGQRMNAGVAASAIFDNGLAVETSAGLQLRLENSDVFNTDVGIGEERSDIVGSLNVRYKNIVGVENRFRIDDDTGTLRRVESNAFFNYWRLSGGVNYVRLAEEEDRREELTGSMRVRLTDEFSVGGAWREDLEAGKTITQDLVFAYGDECSSLELVYRRDLTRDVGLEPDTSVFIRFTLRSLVD